MRPWSHTARGSRATFGGPAVERHELDAVRQQHQARFYRYARNVATLHFIYGWPGAGKTTLARALGERARAVVFCEDEWLATLATERITSLQQYVESSARIRRLIAPLATRLLSLIHISEPTRLLSISYAVF